MISIELFTFNPFQENTYLLSDNSGKCIIIDAGMNNPDEQKKITEFIASKKLVCEAMLNTHCHVDHLLGCGFLKDQYDIPFYFHEEEKESFDTVEEYGAIFGLKVDPPPSPEKFIAGGEEFRFGESVLKLIHVPGHSRGSLAIYSEPDKFVITGDALFTGSIGRTDLPGGDYKTLIHSIKTGLLSLPSEVKIFPGHGPSGTIGQEHDTNPFLN